MENGTCQMMERNETNTTGNDLIKLVKEGETWKTVINVFN